MARGLDLLNSLTKAQRALLPFFTSQASTDLSANQILANLKTEGFGIRRQTGLDIIGVLRDQFVAGRQGRLVDNQTILDPDFIPTAITDIAMDYSHQVIVRAVNRETGETSNQNVTVVTDQLLSKDQIFGEASELFLQGSGLGRYPTNYQIDSVEYLGSVKNPNLGE